MTSKVNLYKPLYKKRLSWMTWINTFCSMKEAVLLRVMLGVKLSFWFLPLLFAEYCTHCGQILNEEFIIRWLFFFFQFLTLKIRNIKYQDGGAGNTKLVNLLCSYLWWLRMWVGHSIVWTWSVLVLPFFSQGKNLQLKVGLYGLQHLKISPV